jgi:gliding motility-associated lipoprotein GldH
MLKRLLTLLAIPLSFLAACDTSRVYEQNADIKDHMWDTSQVVTFDVPITDTVSPHNFYVNVRNADAYRYSNLYLFIRTKFPDGRTSNDTLEIILADEKGRWLGDGLGDIWENQVLFKRNVRFPQAGTYRFEYRQGMRDNPLPMIMDVGIRIERAE